MTSLPFLSDIVVVFGTALVVAVVSARVAMPPLVAYLVAGALVGPTALGWISDTSHVEVLAELGVAFILFAIGLELPVERMRKLGSFLLAGGGMQVALTAGVAAGALTLAGYGPSATALYAFTIALSSTAIVLRLVQARRELEAPHGRFATGVLIAQDLLIVPLLVLVPFLAGTADVSLREVALRFGGGIAAIVAMFAIGRLVLAHAFRLIAQARARELLTLAALFLCFGGGLATESVGFSLALGGFLAGVLLADSDYHHHIIAETGPFRDVLASFFFVTVGMLLDVRFVAEHAALIAALALVLIAVKAAVAGGVACILGFPLRTALLAGVALAQVGEFSLVLLRRGHHLGLVDDWHFQLSIATAVVTMLLTPAVLAAAARVLRVQHDSDHESATPGLTDHVLIVGFGTNGRNLAQVLAESGIPYLVVDANPRAVRAAKDVGVPIVFGDCARHDIQRMAGIETARLVVFAVSDPEAARVGVRIARELRPDVHILARARTVDAIRGLRDAGADAVVSEEFEASIEIAIEVMRQLHIPGNVVRAQAALLREGGYEALRGPRLELPSGDAVRAALAAGTGDTFWLAPDNPAVGASLRSLRLREQSGASAVAILRGERVLSNPGADAVLEAGDVLVLIGAHAQVDRAFALLSDESAQSASKNTDSSGAS